MNTRAEVVKVCRWSRWLVVALVCGGCVANKAYRADGNCPARGASASVQLGGRVVRCARWRSGGPGRRQEDSPCRVSRP